MDWDPELYDRFRQEREQPFVDALALVKARPGLSIVDLGCGTGALTRRLADALGSREAIGIDSSPEMMKRAAAEARPGLVFHLRSLEEQLERPERFDLVFSHALIQWIDHHEQLIGRLLGLCSTGGQLVVQLPSNHDSAFHRLLREVAREEPFAAALGGYQRLAPVLPLERYAELLWQAGGREICAFEKVYPHVLPNAEAVEEFTRSTAQRPYLERLAEPLGARFSQRYRERLRALYPGSVFFGFRRILFTASVGHIRS
jgi:trans-aconitate 2-methyltransferase